MWQTKYASALTKNFRVGVGFRPSSAQRCVFPVAFGWIYYCHSSKSTGKETGKTHPCAVEAIFLLGVRTPCCYEFKKKLVPIVQWWQTAQWLKVWLGFVLFVWPSSSNFRRKTLSYISTSNQRLYHSRIYKEGYTEDGKSYVNLIRAY